MQKWKAVNNMMVGLEQFKPLRERERGDVCVGLCVREREGVLCH